MIGLSLVYPLIVLIFDLSEEQNEFMLKLQFVVENIGIELSQTSLIVCIVGLIFGKALLMLGYRYVVAISVYSYMVGLRADIYDSYFKSTKIILDRDTSKVLNALTTQSHAASSAMQLQFNILQSVITLAMTVVLGFLISPKLMLAAMLLGSVLFYLSKFTLTWSRKMGRNLIYVDQEYYKNINQILQNYEYLKSSGVYRHFKRQVSEVLKRVYKINIFFVLLNRGTQIMTEPVVILSLAVVLFSGLNYLSVEIASVMLMYVILARTYYQIGGLVGQYQGYNKDFVAVGYCNDFLRDSQRTVHLEKRTNRSRFDGQIKINNIAYTYGDQKIFDNLSLTINQGETVCLTGSSGTGKSTLLNLMLGTLQPLSGQITISDIEPHTICIDDCFTNVGIVTQSPAIFDLTVRHNLTIKNPDVSDEQLEYYLNYFGLNGISSVESANLDYMIVDQGNNLSGGERQRLAFIREIVGKPNLLILDEPTSSIDRHSTEKIFNYLSGSRRDITTIYITHDQSLYDYADTVYRFENNSVSKLDKSKNIL